MITVPTSELRGKLQAFIDKSKEEPVVITAYGNAVAVLLSPKEYDRLRLIEARLREQTDPTASPNKAFGPLGMPPKGA